jgi:hypothetical protein
MSSPAGMFRDSSKAVLVPIAPQKRDILGGCDGCGVLLWQKNSKGSGRGQCLNTQRVALIVYRVSTKFLLSNTRVISFQTKNEVTIAGRLVPCNPHSDMTRHRPLVPTQPPPRTMSLRPQRIGAMRSMAFWPCGAFGFASLAVC